MQRRPRAGVYRRRAGLVLGQTRTAMSIYKRSPDVIATDLGDELILLDPRRGEMFGLNESGRRVWLGLEQSLDDVASAIAAEFGIEPARARADVETLLAALTDAGLVERTDAAASSPDES